MAFTITRPQALDFEARKGKVHLWLQISCCMTQSGTRVQDRPIAAADFLQIPKPARHNDLHLHIFKHFSPKKNLLVVSPVECRRRRHTEILQIQIEIQIYKYTNTQMNKCTNIHSKKEVVSPKERSAGVAGNAAIVHSAFWDRLEK